MTEKGGIIKKEINQTTNGDILLLVERKIDFFKDVIQKTIIHVQKNKFLDILGISDVSDCIEKLGDLSKKIQEVTDIKNNTDNLINKLQLINNELSCLLKNYGTYSLEDLLLICFGNNNKITINNDENEKLDLLKKYFHPTSYKVINKKDELKIKKLDDIDENINFLCSDVVSSYKQFHMKVYGIKFFIHSTILKKSLMIFGIVDDIVIDFLNNKYVTNKKKTILENSPQDDEFKKDSFGKFVESLILKDYLIYENEVDVYCKYIGYVSQNNTLKQKQISQIVKDFITDDMFNKRNLLINLLTRSSNYDNQYLAYLLYDLLSNDLNGNVDTQEQTLLFDSFPWTIKQYFKQAMKKTIQYTNELSNFDINKIPLEQQICLLKASDSVKEKAMLKLKEVKSKSEDSGSKARQYLDGLLKIPFNIYKREPILSIMDKIRKQFKDTYKKYNIEKIFPEIPNKDKYTSIEVLKYIKKIQGESGSNDKNKQLEKIKIYLTTSDKKKLTSNVVKLNELLKKYNKNNNKNDNKIKQKLLNKEQLKYEIEKYIELCKNIENNDLLNETIETFITECNINPELNNTEVKNDVTKIINNMKQITEYMTEVKTTLDKVVYGHENAKKQIERVIGQWINGDIDGGTSHILGFEGNPGIGKTTLAKGLSECLKDENGISRPFSLVALGGDSNASTLVGHSYTYVGSNYGSIVQILIDKKCMNPIILFDEVDKISKTEHGREITGILTHLLDTTQNSCFQDKYFSGIELDLSKALFILSYNDVESIDKILLDRVHRIKFDSLTIEDKIIISNKHLLPELYKQIGLEDMIIFSDEVLKFIIEEYTLESGVRKLKEKLFEIVADINLEILKETNNDINFEFPLEITIDNIKNKFFKDKREVKVYKIHNESIVGVINALWANQMSQGGVLPLQASYIPSNKFLDLILTGSMGEVMKESISVSLTNAWNLTCLERQKYLIEKYNDIKQNSVSGIHIHCPDISTKKDGPSATTAFTILIYSLLNDIKIKNYFGITGETHFGHLLTEIGGLEAKIIHSIKSGIKEFIFPKENQTDFIKIQEKYKNNKILDGIKFHSINHINDAMNLILDK
jgi:ATP-dependent Lon protease